MDTHRQLITLPEAGRLAERSPTTVRRWVKDGRLADRRAPGDKSSPLVVDRAELLACLAEQTPKPAPMDTPASNLGLAPGLADAHAALVAELRARVEDAQRLAADRAEALARALADLAATRAELAEARRTADHLRSELTHKGRGLLGWLRG